MAGKEGECRAGVKLRKSESQCCEMEVTSVISACLRSRKAIISHPAMTDRKNITCRGEEVKDLKIWLA